MISTAKLVLLGMATGEPPCKRTRRLACPCSKCLGRERDHRTVVTHMNLMPCASTSLQPQPTMNITPLSTQLHHSLEFYDEPGLEASAQCDRQESTQSKEDKVVAYIVKEVGIKLKYGHSQSEIEEHLKNATSIVESSIPIPTKWNEVLKLLKKLGYKDPKHYKVCASEDHSVILRNAAEHCHICSKPCKSCIDYYVLGLHFEDWFCTDDRCDQLLSHWKNKDEWLEANSESRLSELWHGKRWKELAYFWDSKQQTLLPERCQQCKQIIRTSTITEAVSDPTSCLQITLTCPVCKSENILVPRYMQGDPRNQAILIHEDGWAPHSTSSKHSIAAITITKACMSKLDRSQNKNAQVYSFIPVNQLPKDSPHKFDAFF